MKFEYENQKFHKLGKGFLKVVKKLSPAPTLFLHSIARTLKHALPSEIFFRYWLKLTLSPLWLFVKLAKKNCWKINGRSSEQCTAVDVFINFFRNFQNNYKKQIHSVVFVNLY